jgi:hypothetical protein
MRAGDGSMGVGAGDRLAVVDPKLPVEILDSLPETGPSTFFASDGDASRCAHAKSYAEPAHYSRG